MSDKASDLPVALRGVTESVVTTLGPNDRWNVAALGLRAREDGGPVTARTWGRTRTWRNFTERGEGYVQFINDPGDFVEAALTVREEADPVLESADAWVRVDVSRRNPDGDGGSTGTEPWMEWELRPVESAVERETVPTINRGFNAVVEATVAASRLDVDEYDAARLLERLAHYESVVETCGGEREREAFATLVRHTDAEW